MFVAEPLLLDIIVPETTRALERPVTVAVVLHSLLAERRSSFHWWQQGLLTGCRVVPSIVASVSELLDQRYITL